MIKQVSLNYDFEIFLNADYSVHTGSCTEHQKHELTDIHDKFGGFPPTYQFDNTTIHQVWWTSQDVDFNEIGEQLGIEVITISSILQPPGCTIPWHRDTFFKINQLYPDRTETKVRANIYLENAKIGHFLQYEINDELFTSVDWQAGQGYLWDSQHLHLGANAGMEDKYTLQISGFLV